MLALNRVIDALTEAVRIVALILATAIFAVIIFTVVSRYGFNWVLSWSEEVPRYLLIWVAFLTAAIGVDRKDHIAFEYLLAKLPKRQRRKVEVLINVGMFAFGWIMFQYGIVFVQQFGGDFMESIPLTNIWYYTSLPICGFLIMLYTLRDELNILTGHERVTRHDKFDPLA